MPMIRIPATDSNIPNQVSNFHPSSAQVDAHHDNAPDAIKQPKMMSGSRPEVANAHQP